MRQQAMQLDVGRRADHAFHLSRAFHELRPLGQALLTIGEPGMGSEAQKAVTQFVLEAIHHRQDSDQRRHSHADAEHGDPADKGDKELAAARAYVAQSDEKRQGKRHAVGAVRGCWIRTYETPVTPKPIADELLASECSGCFWRLL